MRKLSDLEIMSNLKLSEYEYMCKHWDIGGAFEGDFTINEITRAKIHIYSKIYERCFLLNSDPFHVDEKLANIDLVPYYGQKVYNFQFEYIVPVYDEELVCLAKRYQDAEFPSGYEAIKQISDRVYELGGEYLRWA